MIFVNVSSCLYSSVMRSNWIAITAGVGSIDFEKAAIRVCEKLNRFPQISKTVRLSTEDIPSLCPEVFSHYQNHLNANTRGYGYMSYKAELVFKASQGEWGDYEGVLWVDAGCEVLVNSLTVKRLDSILEFALQNGVSCFSLETPELSYTKREMFELFPEIDPFQSGSQIQSTWFAISGEVGKQIAEKWLRTILSGIEYLDLNPSSKPEFDGFVEHRYDQSAFSLVCKEFKVDKLDYQPVSGRTWKSKMRGISHPIWTARNRSGNSIIPSSYKLTEKLFEIKNKIKFVDSLK